MSSSAQRSLGRSAPGRHLATCARADERVRWSRRPIDPPQLPVPNGPVLDATGPASGRTPHDTFLGLVPLMP